MIKTSLQSFMSTTGLLSHAITRAYEFPPISSEWVEQDNLPLRKGAESFNLTHHRNCQAKENFVYVFSLLKKERKKSLRYIPFESRWQLRFF